MISFDGLAFQEITKFLISATLVIGCDHSLSALVKMNYCKFIEKESKEKLQRSVLLNIQDRTFESLWSANTRKPTIEKSRGACTTPRGNIVQHVLARVALLNSKFLPQHFNIVYAFYYTRLITLLNYLISLKITKKVCISNKGVQ